MRLHRFYVIESMRKVEIYGIWKIFYDFVSIKIVPKNEFDDLNRAIDS